MIDVNQLRAGYRIHYRHDEVNHCPGCGQTQWIVGRLTAECAFCATALPVRAAGMTGIGLFRAEAREPKRLPIAA
jgi:hypothetical protein